MVTFSERVVILARTLMHNNHVCIGGYSMESKKYVRLLTADGLNQQNDIPFQIGEIYQIKYDSKSDVVYPHSEDICVYNFEFLENMKRFEFNQLLNDICIRDIHIKDIFDGLLDWTTGKGFLLKSQRILPSYSVLIVKLNHDLFLSKTETDDKQRFYYIDNDGDKKVYYKVPYVGVNDLGELKKIVAGRNIRFSLARWWDNDGNFPDERAYLQLSGIF
ncbi:dual OB domain-containing protein [Conchiformibius steedae]|uniref:Dual OB-containing domain-containing protein n=1 Tax=Conchiformibius steedae TaxID=153493 RepID=A0A3P2A3D6_9NEIS|nr:hypothetical protein [Conchiformibius steedae]RRD89952.1 hypothetical protein EII21_06970 [Conchiformibius steedae]